MARDKEIDLCFVVWLSASGCILCDTVFTFIGSNATLPCSSNIQYPKWDGPSGNGSIMFNYAGNTNFANPALGEKHTRLSWGQNLRDLIVKDTILGDEGSYNCTGVRTMNSTELIMIVPPQPPVISNITKLADNREVIYGNEGQPLTISCTSRGGKPSPTVIWYKDSISGSNQMALANTGTLQSNGTYTVTLQHTFTPTVSDDRKTLICRSYYPQAESADRGSKTESVILYLALKPSQPTVTQTAVVNTGNTVEVSCRTTGSRPAANISWSYQSSTTKGIENTSIDATTETFTVVSLFRKLVTATDNGRNLQCVVSHQALVSPPEETASAKLNVTFSVEASTTRITGNKEMIATGQTPLTLTCTTGSSNPASDITWKNGSVTLPNSRPYTPSSGENNGVVRSQPLIFNPTRYMDGDVITCSVSNIVSQSSVVDIVTLNLKYRPLIEPMSEIIAVERNTTILTCVASSKPVSTFKWYREGQTGVLHQGTGTLGSNKLSYTINKVSRTDAATYRCNADNRVEIADNKNVPLTVYYPPDVSAMAENTTVNASTAMLTCNASGIPNNDYKYGKWIQTWPGYEVPVSEKPGNEKLVLTHLTYEHSGVYTCSASNGIKVFGTNKEFMEGSVILVVKSFPVITNYSEKAPAKLKENATIEVNTYSNAAGSEFKIFINNNGSRQTDVIYSISEEPVEIDLPVFTHKIKISGKKVRILIQIQSKDDIGFYDVDVSNEIGTVTRSFEIVPKGPPNSPYNITVDKINYNTAMLSWIRGYHGGFVQTFVIQLSTDQYNWRNISVYGGKDESQNPLSEVLTDLHSSTTYYVRMYAFNQEGISPYTYVLNYTTRAIKGTGSNMSAIIGGAAGGGCALIIILLVIGAVFLKRKEFFTKGKAHSEDDKSDRKPVYSDENDYGMQDNPMYVSAGPRNQEQAAGGSRSGDAGAIYSTVDKKKPVASSNDVYAEVDKSKKTKANTGKKEKKEKSKPGFMKDKKGKKSMQEGDLYENATELKATLAKQNKNDEIIYENPEPSKPAEKKNVNKDGLIYADLTFNDQPKGQKKLVIHGLDSMTEYVQVDFTKKADPLPDSDDENNPPTK